MNIYTPTAYEEQALDWASLNALALADKVLSGIDYFYELRGEAGPHIDEYAQARLDRANKFLKDDYAALNSAWVAEYRKAWGKDNS